jgi:hypothetical protein
MMDESFITRPLMSAALLLRDVQPPRHRALALFLAEMDDEQFWEQMRQLELREAAAVDATAVETVPSLRIVK